MAKPTKVKADRKGLHANHRQRMRKRLIEAPESLQDHELLEMLLYYTQPRVNTNEIAHLLLNHCGGSISELLEAPEETLQEVERIGPRSAHFIREVAEVMDSVLASPCGDAVTITSGRDLYELILSRLDGLEPPFYTVVFLTDANTVCQVRFYPGVKTPELIDICRVLCDQPAAKAAIVEWDVSIPPAELETHQAQVRELAAGMKLLDCPLYDYYVHAPGAQGLNSYRRRGLLLSV